MKVIKVTDGSRGCQRTFEPVVGTSFSVDAMQEIIDAFKRCFAQQADFFIEFEEV